MKVFTVTYGDYWNRERFQFSVKALNGKTARAVAEKSLVKAFKSFSFSIYRIQKQKEF